MALPSYFEIIPAFQQFLDSSGNPLVGGTVETYQAGTSTPKVTYREADGVTSNGSSVTLDSNGNTPYGMWGTTGAYKIVLKNSLGSTIRTRDNVRGINDLTSNEGAPRVVGANCANNTTTPNTQFDMDADWIMLASAADNTTLTVKNPSLITCNVSTAGPVANGRDQSGSFSSSSWIHLYWIHNGTTLATIASAVAPPTGPTLPSGYTHWAYAGAIRFNGSSQLVRSRIRGDQVSYDGYVTALSSGTATSETDVSISSLIPPNAMSVDIAVDGFGTTDGSGNIQIVIDVYVLAGTAALTHNIGVASGLANSAVLRIGNWNSSRLPNVSQNLRYKVTNTLGSAGTASIYVLGYTVPNG